MFVHPPAANRDAVTVTLTRTIDAPPAAVARACRDATLLRHAASPTTAATDTATVAFSIAHPDRAAILLGHLDGPVQERRPLRVTHLAAPGHRPPLERDPTDAPLCSADHLTLAVAFAPQPPAATATDDNTARADTPTKTLCTLLVQLSSAEPCRAEHTHALSDLAEAWAQALARACVHDPDRPAPTVNPPAPSRAPTRPA